LFWFLLAHLTNWNLACIIWLLCLFTKSSYRISKSCCLDTFCFVSISYFTCLRLRVTNKKIIILFSYIFKQKNT
jgi:hypothetical protein